MKIKKFNNKKGNKKELDDWLGIERINNNCLWLKSGACIGVISIKPVDFYSMSYKKKKFIFKVYQDWLESLEYPVQICGRTINSDIVEHIKILKVNIEHSIKKRKNYNRFLARFREFWDWLYGFVSEQCSSGRFYYVCIPFFPFKGQGIDILESRCSNALHFFSKAGLCPRRLDDVDLRNLYSSYFNDFFVLSSHKKDVYTESKDWINLWRDNHG